MSDGTQNPGNEHTADSTADGRDAPPRYSAPSQAAHPGEYSRPGEPAQPAGEQRHPGSTPHPGPDATRVQPDSDRGWGAAPQAGDSRPTAADQYRGTGPDARPTQGDPHPQPGQYRLGGQGAAPATNPWDGRRQSYGNEQPGRSSWARSPGGYYGAGPAGAAQDPSNLTRPQPGYAQPQHPGAQYAGSQHGQSQHAQPQYAGAQYPQPQYPPSDSSPTEPVQGVGAPVRPGRGKLLAGALALALVAGGIGGAVVAAFDDNGSGTSAITSLSQTASGQPVATAPDGTVQSVADAVLPSVVQIEVVANGSGGEGSGVVLSEDGFILTNNHVVADAAAAGARSGAITVAFSDGSTATAEIVGRDPSADIAVIKVGKSGLTPIAVGSSSSLAVGQNVVAVGSPLGLAGTVTTGIVSALDRPVSATGEGTQDQSSVLDAIQTDAAINPGNSGGALVNLNGELIGINSAIASLGAQQGGQSGSIGLGFAIPIDQANRIAQELIKNGVATQAVLGVQLTNAPNVRGATVSSVEPGGAAEQAGIDTGAVITRIDDRAIPDTESLVAAVRSYAPSSKVTIEVTASDGSISSKDVALGSQEVGTR